MKNNKTHNFIIIYYELRIYWRIVFEAVQAIRDILSLQNSASNQFITQSVGLKWLIDWYRTPFKHFKIKDKTKFESFLDKIGAPKKFLDKIAAYGFYSDFENPNLVIVRHNEIT